MSQIVEPRTELLALIAATGQKTDDLARETGIPKTRIENALRGFRPLSIDDLTAIKKNLCAKLAEKQRTYEKRDNGAK